MERKFEANEFVYLTAASQRVQVIGYNTHGEVICFWRNKDGDTTTGTFPEEFLEKVVESEGPGFWVL